MDSTTKPASAKVDVFSIVTNRVIELLEEGKIPWKQPWTSAGVPMNALSKRPYRGINLWMLLSLNFERNLFLTWEQIKQQGGSVKVGEHGHLVVYWKVPKKNDDCLDGEKRIPVLRYYKVFNIAQCTGLPEGLYASVEEKEHKPILECEAIVAGMPKCPEIRHKQQEAFYHLGEDYINMPKKKSFESPELYYATLFHELVHSTGHERRLNRKSITDMAEFGSELYSQEELIAEMGSAYLSSFTGIGHKSMDNTVAYIHGWLDKLKNDKRFIIQASGQAQKAVDFILNQQPVQKDEEVQDEIVAGS